MHKFRQSEADLILPKPKTNSMENAFSDGGAEVWNSLSSLLLRNALLCLGEL